MIVGATRNQSKALFLKGRSQRLCILYNVLGIFFEIILHSFIETLCLPSYYMHQRTTLNSRENHSVQIFRILFFTENNATSWTS